MTTDSIEAAKSGRDSKEFMSTLAKGLAVLRCFGVDRPSMTLAEAAAATGVTRATARRILLTLTDLGYVTQTGRQFSLAPRVLELGYGYFAARDWVDSATGLLKQLSGMVEETCSIAVLQDTEIVIIGESVVQRIVSMNTAVGARLPAFHTAAGRIQLGYLKRDDIWQRLKRTNIEYYTPGTIVDPQGLVDRVIADRDQGFSIVDEELERGLRALAVPLLNRNGTLVAAVNISASANRTTREHLREVLLPQLRDITEKMTLLLG